MSADDMISKTAALEAVKRETGFDDDHPAIAAIADLPTVTVGVRGHNLRSLLAKAVDDLSVGREVDLIALERSVLAALTTTPAPDAAAIREATARLHKLAYWLDTDAEVLADMDQRDLSDHQHIQAEVNAILALLPKGGA